MLTFKEFSAATNISERTLRRMMKSGKLIPAQYNGKGKPSLFSEGQIAEAITLRGKSSPTNDVEAATADNSNDGEDAIHVSETEHADISESDETPTDNDNTDIAIDVDGDIIQSEDRTESLTLEQRVARIRQLNFMREKANVVFDIAVGRELIAAKSMVGHGNWSDWLKENFEWTQQTANNFMRIAERFGSGKLKNVFQFQRSQLQALLSLPVGEEQEFVDAQAEAGKPVVEQSAREVQRNVKAWTNHATPTEQNPVEDSHVEESISEDYQSDNEQSNHFRGFVDIDDDTEFNAQETSTPQNIELITGVIQPETFSTSGIGDGVPVNEDETLSISRDEARRLLDDIAALVPTADICAVTATIDKLKSIRDYLRKKNTPADRSEQKG